MKNQKEAKPYILSIYSEAIEFLDNVLTEKYGKDVTDKFDKIKPIITKKLNSFTEFQYTQLFIIPENSEYTEYISRTQAINRFISALTCLSIKLLNGYELTDISINNDLTLKLEPDGTFIINMFN